MTSNAIAFVVGLLCLTIFFVLKVGLFNNDATKIDAIGRTTAAAEFPIDGMAAIFPLFLALSYENYVTYPEMAVIPLAVLVASIGQVYCFKSIRRRLRDPSSKYDVIVIPASFFWIYVSFFGFAAITFNIAQENWL